MHREEICPLRDTVGEAVTPMRPRAWQEEKDKRKCLQLSLVAPASLLLLYFVDNSVIYFFACIPFYSLSELDTVYKDRWIIARWKKNSPKIKTKQRSKNRKYGWNQV